MENIINNFALIDILPYGAVTGDTASAPVSLDDVENVIFIINWKNCTGGSSSFLEFKVLTASAIGSAYTEVNDSQYYTKNSWDRLILGIGSADDLEIVQVRLNVNDNFVSILLDETGTFTGDVEVLALFGHENLPC